MLKNLVLALMLALPVSSAAADKLATDQKAMLQAAMRQFIDRSAVDRRFLHLDLASGTVRALSPVAAHPMMLRMGSYFVLCSDFRDDKGLPVNVDFYLAKRGTGYVVFHTEIDHREPLDRLMKAGKVAALD